VAFDLVLSPGINCGDADVVIVHALFQRLRELSAESSATRGLQKWHQAAYYQVMARLETRIYRNPAVHLAAVSPRTKADLQRYFARGDVTVIPNAVDSAAFSPSARLARRGEMRSRWALDEEEFVLLLIGNDWRVKGLPTILEAMALLSDLPLRLLVAGSDAAEPFRDLARELGVLQRCIWEPAAGNVLGFYAAADVYVSPSLEDSFALPVAESMACGLPAITSVNAGISAYLTDGVDALVLTDPRDARALAERLRELHDKPDLIQDMGDAGARKALEWTWERNAAQIWDLLQTALRNK
jgi:UDP-glucose:(heptosyl)LPS alpha-1,3-glucosyltransferase